MKPFCKWARTDLLPYFERSELAPRMATVGMVQALCKGNSGLTLREIVLQGILVDQAGFPSGNRCFAGALSKNAFVRPCWPEGVGVYNGISLQARLVCCLGLAPFDGIGPALMALHAHVDC